MSTQQLPLLSEVRPEVAEFARLMEYKLRQNDHKGGWKDWDPVAALARLRDETEELRREIEPPTCGCREAMCPHAMGWWPGSPEKVGMEAADVANFAMMIADMCGALDSARLGGENSGEGESK